MQLIRKLELLGYKIFLKEDRLCYEFIGKGKPDPNTVTELLQGLKKQKNEILSYLRFAQSNAAVKIHSNLLNEDIWLLSDEKMRESLDDDLVVYLPGEIKHLTRINVSPEQLRKIHACKKVFPGSKIVWN